MKVKEQTVLGIDASGFSVSVGLMERGVAKGQIYINDGSPGSEILLATVEQLLSTLKMEKQNLDGICVTMGPGAFTSLRISLAVSEALALGLSIPVYGVDTLKMIAGTLPYYQGKIKVIQNAYKGEFYTATYITESGKPREIEEIRLVTPGVFVEALEEGDLVLGTGLDTLFQKGIDLEDLKVRWDSSFHRNISGISVVEHFLDDEAKEPSLKPLEPIYIRLSDAEINYSKQFGGK